MMGRPKAALQLGGRPLIAYPLAAARAAGLDPVVVAKARSGLPPVDVPVWTEPDHPIHPLRGIVTALERSASRAVVAVGADMPFVSAELLSAVANVDAPVAVPRVGGLLQPLLARYDPSLRRALAEALERRAPLGATVAALEPRILEAGELSHLGALERLFFNVNTPDDLVAAERMKGGS